MKAKNKNITIAVNTEIEEYIKILKTEYNMNVSAFFRNVIKKEYERVINDGK